MRYRTGLLIIPGLCRVIKTNWHFLYRDPARSCLTSFNTCYNITNEM